MKKFKIGDKVVDRDSNTERKIKKFITRENGLNVIFEDGLLAHITNIEHAPE